MGAGIEIAILTNSLQTNAGCNNLCCFSSQHMESEKIIFQKCWVCNWPGGPRQHAWSMHVFLTFRAYIAAFRECANPPPLRSLSVIISV